jgi:Kdo2-lipid IVA lauroyltransferase/acyltransferase
LGLLYNAAMIKQAILKTLYRITHCILTLFAMLPLPIIHALGTVFGWLAYVFASKHKRILNKNIALYIGTQDKKLLLNQNIAETGKAFFETFPIWLRSHVAVLGLVKNCTGWQHVETALAAGKGIIFLTPHLGCFEITSLYYGAHHPMAVLYRPPRQRWLLPLIESGRQRGNITLAPANGAGVKQLLQALKRGEAIGMLPDQAPFEGEGEWAPFFCKPAYTMTLAGKLAQKTGAQVLMAFGERLLHGGGYHIHITPIDAGGIATPALMNAAIERTIQQCPAQYLWSYDRYKARYQALPPDYYG